MVPAEPGSPATPVQTRSNGMVALACLSASIISYQVILMQVLASVVWYHFAYLIISFALLGFGLSGTLLAIPRFGRRLAGPRGLAILAATCAASMPGAIILLGTDALRIDLYGVFADPTTWIGPLLVEALLLVPFTTGALVVAILLLKRPARAGVVYGINLSASALGALTAPILVEWILPHHAVGVPAALAAAGSLALLRDTPRSGRILTSIILIAGLVFAAFPSLPRPSGYKDLSRILALPQANLIETSPSAHGIFQRVRSPALRLSVPLSLSFPGTLPLTETIFVNGDAVFSRVIEGGDLPTVAAWTPEGILSELVQPGPIWILEPENSVPIAQWSDQSTGPVTVTVRHPRLAALLREDVPDLTVVSTGPRARLGTITERPSLIRFPSPNAPSGSAGLGALGEQPLFTAEAMTEAWIQLQDRGLLVVTAPIDHPLRSAPRLLRTLLEGLRRAGEQESTASVLGLRTWSTLTFVAQRGGFQPTDLVRIKAFAADRGFDLMAGPILPTGPVEIFNRFADPDELDRLDRLFSSNGADGGSDSLFQTTPPTDNRPYFSQFLRITRIPDLLRTTDLRSLAYLELGLPIVAITVIQLTVVASILILLPWIGGKGLRLPAGGTTAAFGCAAGLGLGFIAAEIGMLQRIIFLTGNPVAAAALILGMLLLSAGAGSWFGQNHPHFLRGPARPAALIAALFAIHGVAGSWLVALPPSIQIAALTGLTGLAGFFMGLPFPRLIMLLGEKAPRLLPWTWGVNGFLSVIGAPVAALIAVTGGYSILSLTAAAAYALAAVCGLLLVARAESGSS